MISDLKRFNDFCHSNIVTSSLTVTQCEWVNLCTEYPDTCCTPGLDLDKESSYWVIRSARSWGLQKVECYLKTARYDQ